MLLSPRKRRYNYVRCYQKLAHVTYHSRTSTSYQTLAVIIVHLYKQQVTSTQPVIHDRTHVVLLKQVLAQPRRHELPASLGVSAEVCLAALAPRGRHIGVELHCSQKRAQKHEQQTKLVSYQAIICTYIKRIVTSNSVLLYDDVRRGDKETYPSARRNDTAVIAALL